MAGPATLGTWTLGTDYLGVQPATVAYRSGLSTLTPVLVASDLNNSVGANLTPYLLAGSVDSDITRQNSQSQCDITLSDPSLITAWQWVAPYLTVTPEVGPAITAQLGLFRLEEPKTVNTGGGARTTEAIGQDVVQLLDNQILTAPLTIPPLVNIGRVLRTVTALAGAPPLAPNLVVNPDFATQSTHWTTTQTANMPGTWTALTGRSYSWHGAIKFVASGATATGEYAGVYQATADLPALVPGTSSVTLTCWTYMTDTRNITAPVLEFYDGSGAQIGGTHIGPDCEPTANEWVPVSYTLAVPDGAVKVRAQARFYARATGVASTSWVDHFWLGATPAVTGITRMAYPATTQQTSVYTTYKAGETIRTIVNDYLAAIGCYPVYATPDGQPTSAPVRNLNRDTPARTWTTGVNAQIVTPLTVERNDDNLYNVVVTASENYTTKTTLTGVARNDDANDPWSTVNRGEVAKPLVTVTHEATQAALNALALKTLHEASVTEHLTLSVLPDPGLTLYQAVSVSGAAANENGVWAIEQLTYDLDPSNPVVTVGARRTFGGNPS